MADLSHHTRDLHRGAGVDVPGTREALRAAVGIAVAALVFYVLATTWIGTCTGAIADAAGCGVPQQAMLLLGTPAILFAGGVWAFTRGARAPEDQTAWFTAGSTLLALMVISAAISLPSLPV